MDSSCEDLRVRFLAALASAEGEQGPDPKRVWRLLVEHPYYQDQVEACARRLVFRSGLAQSWLHDIPQEAMIFLARSLERAPDLGLDRQRAERHFPGWLRSIVFRDCLQALRSLRRQVATHATAPHDRTSATANLDLCIDLSSSIKRLDEPDCSAIRLFLADCSVKEISEKLGLSYRQAGYALRRGLKKLQQCMAPSYGRAATADAQDA